MEWGALRVFLATKVSCMSVGYVPGALTIARNRLFQWGHTVGNTSNSEVKLGETKFLGGKCLPVTLNVTTDWHYVI